MYHIYGLMDIIKTYYFRKDNKNMYILNIMKQTKRSYNINIHILSTTLFLLFFIFPYHNIHATIKQCSKGAINMYQYAIKEAHKGHYEGAIDTLNSIIDCFPFSIEAEKSYIFITFLSTINGDYPTALLNAESYVKVYPKNNLEYSYYAILIANAELINGYRRDTIAAQNVIENYIKLRNSYPKSIFLKEINTFAEYAYDIVVAHKMHVAKYYLSSGAYITAIRELYQILERDIHKVFVEEVYLRLAEAYSSLNLIAERDLFFTTIKREYPDSVWINEFEKFYINQDNI